MDQLAVLKVNLILKTIKLVVKEKVQLKKIQLQTQSNKLLLYFSTNNSNVEESVAASVPNSDEVEVQDQNDDRFKDDESDASKRRHATMKHKHAESFNILCSLLMHIMRIISHIKI